MKMIQKIKTIIKKNENIRKIARKIHFFIYKTKYDIKSYYHKVDDHRMHNRTHLVQSHNHFL